MTTTTAHDKTKANNLRTEAAQHDREAHDSFERCDTDGFVSQWANGLTAQQKRLEANLIENGGTTEIVGPVTADGEPVRWKVVDTRYGTRWLVLDDNDDAVDWLDVTVKNFATLRRKGYSLGQYRVKGIAEIVGGGRGLAGAANCYAAIVPWFATTDIADEQTELLNVADPSMKKVEEFYG